MLRRTLFLLIVTAASHQALGASFDKADRLAAKLPAKSAKTVKQLSAYIQENLSSPTDRLRAAYVWITKNISFDKERKPDFIASFSTDSVANAVLTSRKATASEFAELFQKVAIGMGFEAYSIAGYTKRGKVVDEAGHAWNAIRMDNGQWLLFDTMWGAGSLVNGKFTKKPNTEFFMVEPSVFIKTHMPFDPLWELIAHPIKASAFLNDDAPVASSPAFSYNDTINAESMLFRSEQLEHLCRRLQWAGDVNSSTSTMLSSCKENIPTLKQREKHALEYRNITQFNDIADRVNKVIEHYNTFVALKKTYKEKRISLAQLRTLIDTCNVNIAYAEKKLPSLKFEKDDQATQRNNLAKTVFDLRKQVDIQAAFLKQQKEAPRKKKSKKA